MSPEHAAPTEDEGARGEKKPKFSQVTFRPDDDECMSSAYSQNLVVASLVKTKT